MSASWNRAHEFGQPLTLIADRGVEVGQPPVQLGVQVRARCLVSTIASLQNSMPGAGHRAAPERRRVRPAGRVRSSSATSSADLVLRDIEDQQFLLGRRADPAGPVRLGQVGDLPELGAGGAARVRRDAHVVQPVPLPVHADVVAGAGRRGGGAGPSGRAPPQVLASPAPRGTARRPSRRPGTSAWPGCAAAGSRSRGRGRSRPPRRRAPGRAGRRRRAAGRASGWWTGRRRPTGRSPARRPGPMTPTNETSLISCAVHCEAQPEIVVLYLRGRFTNSGLSAATASVARSIGAGVEDLAGVDAGHRAAEDVARHVAARLQRGQAHLFEPLPDRRHVLDPDPVELHVLPVGDVGEVAAVLLGDARHGAQLLGGQLPAGDADPHHEVGVLDLGVLERAGLAAADAGAALGVQAPPAEPAAQVGRVDRVEARWAYRLTIRSRTFSPASSFLNRSAAFSGSRWPRAHWPWPRRDSDGMSLVLLLRADRAGHAPLRRRQHAGGADWVSGRSDRWRWTRVAGPHGGDTRAAPGGGH